MRGYFRRLLVAIPLFLAMSAAAQMVPPPIEMKWDRLPSIPDREGFAGAFSGVSGGALIMAGGANIPGDKWTEPLVKKWYDSIFVLERPKGKWRAVSRLARPLAYGVSITTGDGLICLGGSDATRHYGEVFLLRWKDGALTRKALAPLPLPCANGCGALLGRTIYLAGGIETPAATVALHTFWSLDLDAPEPLWQELDPWPGPERMLAVSGAFEGSFYLFSGAKLTPDADGQPVREYLRDAYRFTPGHGWTRIADLPRAAVAAPSPAPQTAAGLIIVSGDDGLNVTFQPIQKHPGFPQTALSYDAGRDVWQVLDSVPISRATAPAVEWRDHVVVPNGEVRPRVRTPEVWWVQIH